MALLATARLEAAGLDAFSLDGDEGFLASTLDLGFPAVRSSRRPRTDVEGEIDTTRLFGARAVSITGTITPRPDGTLNRQEVEDRFLAFLRPDRSSYLVYRLETDGEERRLLVRPDQFGAPISHPGSVKVAVGFRAPDGVQESAELEGAAVDAVIADPPGISFPLSFPISWPASTAAGTVVVTNRGNVRAWPRLRLYGPATNPRIENVTVGAALEFTAGGGLELAAGDYLEVDTRERTIRLNGSAVQSRHNRLDFDASEWWPLDPGDNLLRYYPEIFDVGALAEIDFRSAFL